MYRYAGDGSEEDLLRFMVDEYREVHAEDVPPPPSWLSDLREKFLDLWDEHWTPVCSRQLRDASLTVGYCGLCRTREINCAYAGQQTESILRWRRTAACAALVHPARSVAPAAINSTSRPKDTQRLSLPLFLSPDSL